MGLVRLHQAGERVSLYVTGHSLGGGLGSIAAADLALQLSTAGIRDAVDMQCYFFGAPRTGNHSFAALHRELVPATWLMANAHDLVAKRGKLLVLYKHAGTCG